MSGEDLASYRRTGAPSGLPGGLPGGLPDDPLAEPPEPPRLRRLRRLVTLLMAVLILGVITIVALLVIRLMLPPRLPALPPRIALPPGEAAEAITLGRGWIAVVTRDASGAERIRVFDATTGLGRAELAIPPAD